MGSVTPGLVLSERGNEKVFSVPFLRTNTLTTSAVLERCDKKLNPNTPRPSARATAACPGNEAGTPPCKAQWQSLRHRRPESVHFHTQGHTHCEPAKWCSCQDLKSQIPCLCSHSQRHALLNNKTGFPKKKLNCKKF